MGPQRSDDGSAEWRKLCTELDLLQDASALAWGNVLEAYKAALPGGGAEPRAVDLDVALAQYKSARALQRGIEDAMQTHVERYPLPKGE